MLETFTPASFTDKIGAAFTVALAGGATLSLELVSVTPLGTRAPGRDGLSIRTEPFSLEFAGPLAPVLSQGICPLSHPVLGTVGIFLVPVGPRQGTMRYEAVFN